MLFCCKILCILVFITWTALSTNADTVSYTFESPQFANLEHTPLLNRAPNIGSGSFVTSFTSSSAGTFMIGNFQPNMLFQGQALANSTNADVLTISFNMPVTQVEFAWAIIEPGRLDLTSPVGNASQNSRVVQPGIHFQGDVFVFSSVTPFTTFSLAGFNTSGSPVVFAIDNLTVQTSVPEPTTILMLGAGLAGLSIVIRKRHEQPVV